MQCTKILEHLFTSDQSKGEVTIGLEVSLGNGLLQKFLDGIKARMAPVPTRILQQALGLQGIGRLGLTICAAQLHWSMTCNYNYNESNAQCGSPGTQSAKAM